MVFLRGFAPTLSLVLSLVPPVNDDRALHVRQPGYVDKYDFDTSYSFAQTLYGAQSFKSDPLLDLATQSVNADFLSTLPLPPPHASRHHPSSSSSSFRNQSTNTSHTVTTHLSRSLMTLAWVYPPGLRTLRRRMPLTSSDPWRLPMPRCLMLHRPTPYRPMPRRRPQRSLRTLSHTREMPPRTPTPSWSLRPPTSSRPSKSQARTQSSRRHCKTSHSLQGSEKLLTNSLQLEYIL
ncbi:hypothetical protein DFH11DRAFT_1038796 [Phellopilus nigrolimitatus]|nr:hypothetical protein DFH11DRAFT_1038796 [Phellopilus nigrolimitatus]